MGEDVRRHAAGAYLGDADALAEGVDAQLARQHAAPPPWWRGRSSCRRNCRQPAIELMLTTWPRSRVTMPGTTRRHRCSTARRFTSTSRSMSSASASRKVLGRSTPALLTSTSNAHSLASARVMPARSVTSSACAMQPVRSASVRQRLRAARHCVHLQALAAEALDDGGADAGRGAGDECGPVIGEGHGCPV